MIIQMIVKRPDNVEAKWRRDGSVPLIPISFYFSHLFGYHNLLSGTFEILLRGELILVCIK
jgi:hypothetical protein